MSNDSNAQHNLSPMLSSYCSTNVIKECTRVTKITETLIDLFITNLPEAEVIGGVLASSISDHLPIFLLTKMPNSRRTSIMSQQIQDINDKTLRNFCNSPEKIKWDTVYISTTSDNAYDEFLRLFLETYSVFSINHT